jgi:PspA associated protein B
VGILDILFGRSKPVKAQTEKLFAISTAAVTLETRWGLTPAGAGAVVFRPLTSSYFTETERELDDLLALSAREQGSTVQREKDEFGYQWIIVRDPDFEDLVTAIHMVTLTLGERGFRDQLLAAVFRFDGAPGGPVYWIYNYKRGAFYPFVPRGNHQRDNTEELRLSAVMDRELPMEKSPEQWYALWGVPI